MQRLLFDKRITQKTVEIKSKVPPEEFWEHVKLRPGLNSLEYKIKGNLGNTFVIKSRLFFYTFCQ